MPLIIKVYKWNQHFVVLMLLVTTCRRNLFQFFHVMNLSLNYLHLFVHGMHTYVAVYYSIQVKGNANE